MKMKLFIKGNCDVERKALSTQITKREKRVGYNKKENEGLTNSPYLRKKGNIDYRPSLHPRKQKKEEERRLHKHLREVHNNLG